MLAFQLSKSSIFEITKGQRLVSAFIVNLFVEFVLCIIEGLHYVLFFLNTCCHLTIKISLQLVKFVLSFSDCGVGFSHTV